MHFGFDVTDGSGRLRFGIRKKESVSKKKWEEELEEKEAISEPKCGVCLVGLTVGPSTGVATPPLRCSAFSLSASPLP